MEAAKSSYILRYIINPIITAIIYKQRDHPSYSDIFTLLWLPRIRSSQRTSEISYLFHPQHPDTHSVVITFQIHVIKYIHINVLLFRNAKYHKLQSECPR